MNIQIGDYIAKPCEGNLQRFDLFKKTITTKKTGEKVDSETNEGYGMSLENIVQRIMMSNLSENKSTVGLNEFIIEYKKEYGKIMNLFDLNKTQKPNE